MTGVIRSIRRASSPHQSDIVFFRVAECHAAAAAGFKHGYDNEDFADHRLIGSLLLPPRTTGHHRIGKAQPDRHDWTSSRVRCGNPWDRRSAARSLRRRPVVSPFAIRQDFVAVRAGNLRNTSFWTRTQKRPQKRLPQNAANETGFSSETGHDEKSHCFRWLGVH